MFSNGRYAAAAKAFAAKYGDFDPAGQVKRMAGRVQELLEGAGRRARSADLSAAAHDQAARRAPAGVFRA
jgi:hypothetical protein